jgi:protein-S-isoprenylcysteine O-methyltransferase Ste14
MSLTAPANGWGIPFLSSVTNTALLVGVTLAWGPPGRLGEPAVLTALLLAAAARFVDSRRAPSAERLGASRSASHSAAWVAATGVGVLAVDVLALITSSRLHNVGLFAAGALSMAIGVGLRWAAIRELGHRFRDDGRVSEDRVSSGVYRVLRHPADTGLVMLSLGMACLMGSGAAAALWLFAVVPATLRRVALEERGLRAAERRDQRPRNTLESTEMGDCVVLTAGPTGSESPVRWPSPSGSSRCSAT